MCMLCVNCLDCVYIVTIPNYLLNSNILTNNPRSYAVVLARCCAYTATAVILYGQCAGLLLARLGLIILSI